MIKKILSAAAVKNALVVFGLSLIFILVLVATFRNSSRHSYKIELSKVNYKFPTTQFAATSEMIQFKEKIEQSASPSDIDLALLADLYLTHAKKSGTLSSYDAAEKYAQSALKINVRNKNAQIVLVKIMIARHQFQEALSRLDELVGKGFTDVGASLRTSIYLALGRFPEALSQVNFLIKEKPDLGSATLKALVLSHMGQDELALHYFMRAIQIEDINEEVQSVFSRGQFAQFLIKKGNPEQALELCNLALKIIPISPYIQFTKAQAFIAKKEYKSAYQSLQLAFAQSKEPVYLLNMIYVSKLLKKEDDVKVLSEQALEIYLTEVKMNQYGHLVDLANLYFVTGQFQDAYRIHLQNRSLRKVFRSEISLAKTLIKLNRPEEAREILEEQIAIGATDVEADFLMLEILKGEQSADLREIYKAKIAENNPSYNDEILMVIP